MYKHQAPPPHFPWRCGSCLLQSGTTQRASQSRVAGGWQPPGSCQRAPKPGCGGGGAVAMHHVPVHDKAQCITTHMVFGSTSFVAIPSGVCHRCVPVFGPVVWWSPGAVAMWHSYVAYVTRRRCVPTLLRVGWPLGWTAEECRLRIVHSLGTCCGPPAGTFGHSLGFLGTASQCAGGHLLGRLFLSGHWCHQCRCCTAPTCTWPAFMVAGDASAGSRLGICSCCLHHVSALER